MVMVSSGWNGQTQAVTRLSVTDFGRDRGQIRDQIWLGQYRPRKYGRLKTDDIDINLSSPLSPHAVTPS